jgi:hypothetical protein
MQQTEAVSARSRGPRVCPECKKTPGGTAEEIPYRSLALLAVDPLLRLRDLERYWAEAPYA